MNAIRDQSLSHKQPKNPRNDANPIAKPQQAVQKMASNQKGSKEDFRTVAVGWSKRYAIP